jgi:hypothetical protein
MRIVGVATGVGDGLATGVGDGLALGAGEGLALGAGDGATGVGLGRGVPVTPARTKQATANAARIPQRFEARVWFLPNERA